MSLSIAICNGGSRQLTSRFAFRALAVAAQEVPGIDAAGVAILPIELDRIAADSVGAGWSSGGLVHLQQLLGVGLGLARLAALNFSFFDAGGAGTGVAQPGEVPLAL